MMTDFIGELTALLTPLPWHKRLMALRAYGNKKITFSTSLGLEDQAITHAISFYDLPITIITLDTGRLFEQTYALHQSTKETYPNISFKTFYPNTKKLENWVDDKGINSFYNAIENRKICCHIRKIEPLSRALTGTDIWVTGLRRDQSDNRSEISLTEEDQQRKLIKLNPLFDVNTKEIMDYIELYKIPINPMHYQGYPSIGCAPCTRAIEPHEHSRAGRWWWEEDTTQECGLHIKDGKLVRKNA